jgi:hypothetical protein
MCDYVLYKIAHVRTKGIHKLNVKGWAKISQAKIFLAELK